MSRLPQATVAESLADGSLRLVTDNGRQLVAAAAVAAGGWREPRPGQRVALRHDAEGALVAVLPPHRHVRRPRRPAGTLGTGESVW